jgi:spermidine dehydrogenase
VDQKDRELGMDRSISRRDFLEGATAAALGAAVPAAGAQNKTTPPDYSGGPTPPMGMGPDSSAQDSMLAQGIDQDDPRYYPPDLSGMRGSHPGSFEVGHQMRDQGWNLADAENTSETYDLVIVGGGISGLATAHFFLYNVGRSARVLVLDNHDDFGGHAKRNEFQHNGMTLVLNGGTLDIESPDHYNQAAQDLLQRIGIDLDRYLAANAANRGLYSSFGLLGNGYFFDKETWGSDRLVTMTGGGRGGVGRAGRGGGAGLEGFIAKTPLSEAAQKDFLRIHSADQPDYMPGLGSDEKKERLSKISYQDFLLNVARVDKQVLWFVRGSGEGVFCVGADALPALFAWQMGSPGFSGMKLDPTPRGVLGDLPGGQHGRQGEGREAVGVPERPSVHFPDGNATVARLLVRWLLPDALPGTTMESAGTARVKYELLDRADQPARIRLNSTVINAHHDGEVGSARGVWVTYVRKGKVYKVWGRGCVMASWNMFIPYIVPELPDKQKEALGYGVKGPLVYTNVALRNWTSFQKLGIRGVSSPTMFHSGVSLAEAVSLGDLQFPQTPDQPIVVRMEKFMTVPGLPRKKQHWLGRFELFKTPFETFERNIRDQLGRVLGPGGFDPAQDILAITVNRWPHGYAYTYNSLYDPAEWVFTESDQRPCVIARKPYGLISIANSDSEASPHTDAAILAAHRAVEEQLERRAEPRLTQRSDG